MTSRGSWYYNSWKGDITKSGGNATNIGIYFFDMLSWVFGDLKQNKVHLHEHDRAAEYLEFKKANVRWFLPINYDVLPKEVKEKGQRTYRSITVNGEEVEFSDGFFDLHTKSYENIINNKGFGLKDARQSIDIVHEIRKAELQPLKGDYHPLVKLPIVKHPFTNGK